MFLGLALLFVSAVFAAPVNISQFVVNPIATFYVSDIETNPSVFTLSLHNQTSETKAVALRITIVDGSGKQMFTGDTDPAAFPIELAGGATKTYMNTDIRQSALTNVSYDSDIEGKIRQTNRILPGSYTITVTAYTGYIGSTDHDSASQVVEVTNPAAPILIYPVSMTIAATEMFPVFSWSMANVPAAVTPKYTFSIWKAVKGLSRDQVVQSQPLWQEKNVSDTRFIYSSSAEELKAGETYYWQVQAFDNYGNMIGDNNGKSAIADFSLQIFTSVNEAELGDVAATLQGALEAKGVVQKLTDYTLESAESADGTPVPAALIEKIKQGKVEILKISIE